MRSMFAILGFVLIVSLPVAVLAKRTKEKPLEPFASNEQLLTWINGYRRHPEPERVPEAVKAMSRFNLMKDSEQSGIYIGFAAGAIGANPDIAESLVTKMFPLRPEDQVIIKGGCHPNGLWKNRRHAGTRHAM